MAATKATVDGVAKGRARAGARHLGQGLLVVASAGVIVGSFLPWVQTGIGSYGGFAGAGIYTFYVGVLGLAGGLVPSRTLAMAQGAIVAAVAVGLAGWQILRLLSKVGLSGWTPGIGLMMVLASGIVAGRAAWLLYNGESQAS